MRAFRNVLSHPVGEFLIKLDAAAATDDVDVDNRDESYP